MKNKNSVQVTDSHQNIVELNILEYDPCVGWLSAPDLYFHIREIAFFPSFEEAKRYGSHATFIDLTSRTAAEQTLRLDDDNSAGLFGTYEFDSREGALSLKKSESTGEFAEYGSRLKFSLRMKDTSVLSDGRHYMVVTYKTNIKERLALRINNFWDDFLDIAPDISISNGKYVRSEPINIKCSGTLMQDYFERLRHKVTGSTATNNILLYVSPHNESGRHGLSNFEMLYVKSGSATVTSHTNIYILNEGDVFIKSPNSYCSAFCKEQVSTLYSIVFKPEILYSSNALLGKVRSYITLLEKILVSSPVLTSKELELTGIGALIADIITALEERPFAYEITVQARLMTFLDLMLRLNSAEAVKEPLPANLMPLFERAINSAKNNLGDFTTKKAARMANLSYNYFCTQFKKFYGTSFADYLVMLKLHEAERLLLTTQMGTTDIATSLGFANASHFIKKFKQAYGSTPHIFRTKRD